MKTNFKLKLTTKLEKFKVINKNRVYLNSLLVRSLPINEC